MLIVDSQVHVWEPEPPNDPWPEGAQERAATHRPPISPEMLLSEMDEAGVHRAVLVPPFFQGYRNDYTIQAAKDHPDRFRVLPRLDPRAADGPGEVRALMDEPYVLGLRFVLNPAAGVVLNDGSLDWLWPVASDQGIPVMLMAAGQIAGVDALATQYPDLRLTIDHLGVGQAKDAALAEDIAAVCRLARHPNMSIKATTMPHYSAEPYPYPALHPLLKQVVDAYGPARVFWGSDLSRLPGTYRELVSLFVDEFGFLTGDALDAVMGQSLCDWIGWPAD
jgi:L-fuconolactonase